MEGEVHRLRQCWSIELYAGRRWNLLRSPAPEKKIGKKKSRAGPTT